MMCNRVNILCWLTVLLFIATPSRAQDDAVSDSIGHARASLLTITPGKQTFSAFGHTAIRVQAPQHGLDYVFTLETDPRMGQLWSFLTGHSKARTVFVQTDEFCNDTQKQGRGIIETPLKMTEEDVAELWKLLDEDATNLKPVHQFSLSDNCTLAALRKLTQASEGRVDINEIADVWRNTTNGQLLRHDLRHSPWAEFVMTTFLGTRYDEILPTNQRLSPERAAQLITPTKGAASLLLEPAHKNLPHPLSPRRIWAVVLVIAVVFSLPWIQKYMRHLVRIFDGALWLVKTAGFVMLLVGLFWSDLFQGCWNWSFLILNPLPMGIILAARKQKSRATEPLRTYDWRDIFVTCLGTISLLALVLYIAVTPSLGQPDVPHALLAAIIAVRTLSNISSALYSLNNK